eukprot:15446965-Alexandrium_andersonii.AAC.1
MRGTAAPTWVGIASVFQEGAMARLVKKSPQRRQQICDASRNCQAPRGKAWMPRRPEPERASHAICEA